jgi:hypothetical protein
MIYSFNLAIKLGVIPMCRDTNASLNIWEVMNAAKEGKARPRYLQRGKVSFSNTTTVSGMFDTRVNHDV